MLPGTEDLTELQRRFVEEMLETPIAVEAYRKAGGTAKTNSTRRYCAYELLTNPNVSRALEGLREVRANRVQVRTDYVILRLVECVERCMQAEPVLDDEGNPTGEYKFDSAGATKALGLLAKHLGMFEKDNAQKAGTRTEEQVVQSLRDRGIPIDLILKPRPRVVETKQLKNGHAPKEGD